MGPSGLMEPLFWLGAYSPGGLALPNAAPTPAQMYAPRGIFIDGRRLIVADTGNHRLLIWQQLPTCDQQPADIVLGQPDFYTEGPNASGRGPEKGLHLPTGVAVIEDRLFVADAWNHRILVWYEVPSTSDVLPDYVLGQVSLSDVDKNRGGEVSALGLYWPFGLGYVNGWFYVTDTGNRRVLGWAGLPEPDQPPDLILGQDSPDRGLENRGTGVAVNTFRWPHALTGSAEMLYIADAGNHRVLGWSLPMPADCPAEMVLGQSDFNQSAEWPYGKQSSQALRFPYALSLSGETLAVADTANNRVLFWRNLPAHGCYHPAEAVIGQPDFSANGENRWKAVERDTLCWPYGLHLHNNLLAIADSGNNRVMIWQVG